MDNIGYNMDISWKSVRISMQDISTRYPCLDMFRYMAIWRSTWITLDMSWISRLDIFFRQVLPGEQKDIHVSEHILTYPCIYPYISTYPYLSLHILLSKFPDATGPTILHKYSKRKGSGFSMGCAKCTYSGAVDDQCYSGTVCMAGVLVVWAVTAWSTHKGRLGALKLMKSTHCSSNLGAASHAWVV
jgi:hypothetical protein